MRRGARLEGEVEEAPESRGGAREVARAGELDRGVEIEPVGRSRAGCCVDRVEEEDDDEGERHPALQFALRDPIPAQVFGNDLKRYRKSRSRRSRLASNSIARSPFRLRHGATHCGVLVICCSPNK